MVRTRFVWHRRPADVLKASVGPSPKAVKTAMMPRRACVHRRDADATQSVHSSAGLDNRKSRRPFRIHHKARSTEDFPSALVRAEGSELWSRLLPTSLRSSAMDANATQSLTLHPSPITL